MGYGSLIILGAWLTVGLIAGVVFSFKIRRAGYVAALWAPLLLPLVVVGTSGWAYPYLNARGCDGNLMKGIDCPEQSFGIATAMLHGGGGLLTLVLIPFWPAWVLLFGSAAWWSVRP